MFYITIDMLFSIVDELEPCSHGRYLPLKVVASNNNIPHYTLSRLIGGKHKRSKLFEEIRNGIVINNGPLPFPREKVKECKGACGKFISKGSSTGYCKNCWKRSSKYIEV